MTEVTPENHNGAGLVFIVGLPRTGSKLIKVILHQAEDACCRISAETWFFGDLFRHGVKQKIRKFGDMSSDRNVEKLVDYLFSGKFAKSYWLLVKRDDSGFDKAAFLQRILRTDRTDRAIYVAIMEAFAVRDSRWRVADRKFIGDKTPGHLYYVPQILEWFPDAKIIHTFRDPRAIVTSELRKIVGKREDSPRLSLSRMWKTLLVVMYITVTWLYARRLHLRYTRDYPRNYRLSKYEDIVADPHAHIGPLCDFVGIEKNSRMLSPRRADSSFNRNEANAGFAVESLDRWRTRLGPALQRWFRLWTGRHLAEFGYKP